MDYRLRRVENDVAAISQRIDREIDAVKLAIAHEMGQVRDDLSRTLARIEATQMQMQSSVAALQSGQFDKFTPRTETVAEHRNINERITGEVKNVNERITENRQSLDQLRGWAWALVVGLLLSLVTAVFGVLRTIPTPHG